VKSLPKPTKKDAGYYLRVWRAERNLAVFQAAKCFGIGSSQWSLLEAGKRNASPTVAEQLAEATSAPLDIFLFATKGRVGK